MSSLEQLLLFSGQQSVPMVKKRDMKAGPRMIVALDLARLWTEKVCTTLCTYDRSAAVVCHRQLAARKKQREAQEAASSWLEASSIPPQSARVFKLQDLDRSPVGNIGGSGALCCHDTATDVPIDSLLEVSGLVLYSMEIVRGDIVLIFMQVPSVPDLFNMPFLDRGVRAVVEIGSSVFVARLDAVENVSGLVPLDKMSLQEQSRFSIVWNTGRCGSTLMHRMLQKVGALSFSEPWWLQQVFGLPGGPMDDATARVFSICAAVDVMLARKALPAHAPVFGSPSTLGSEYVSFNLKGKSNTALSAIMGSLPGVRHIFMYRDVRKVVESFGSIFFKDVSSLDKVLGSLSGWLPEFFKGGKQAPPQKAPPIPVMSAAVKEAQKAGHLEKPTRPFVSLVTTAWLDAMCFWQEQLAQGRPAEGGEAITLRMDDFVQKDPEMIETLLRFFLGEGVEVSEDAVALALQAFDRHAQEGDLMSKSSHAPGSGAKRFLTERDVMEIEKFVGGVPSVGKPDYVIPGSLGFQG